MGLGGGGGAWWLATGALGGKAKERRGGRGRGGGGGREEEEEGGRGEGRGDALPFTKPWCSPLRPLLTTARDRTGLYCLHRLQLVR